jgi:hypothetical protein
MCRTVRGFAFGVCAGHGRVFVMMMMMTIAMNEGTICRQAGSLVVGFV